MENTYKVKSRNIIPQNWTSGRPVKLFGIYLYTVWTVAKEGYPWNCNHCFNKAVYQKYKMCDECIIEMAKLLQANK